VESRKLRELEARLTLRSLLPEIRDFVQRAQWASKASTLLSTRFPALLRSLTEASKQASEELLNRDFEDHFESECKALRAPPVKLDFPGRKGAAARRKTLTPTYKLSSILSEGEQKVIALADFLAEVSLRETAIPIILDDPVTSLDHRRLQYVADRIAALTGKHQVIVFTHDIRLAVGLLASFEKRTSDCTYYNIERTEAGAGVVSAGTHPRWDTPKQLGKKIESLIREAEKATGETRAALVERAYDVLRSWCEVVVEQDVLCGVSQRFQPNVMMTKLPQIKADRLQKTSEIIFDVFEEACRVTDAHSQPLDTLTTPASLDRLKEDWKRVQEALHAYRS
jgi:hypothetical protein